MPKMKEIWEDPARVGAFSGVSKLATESGKTKAEARKWLKSQLSYSLHRPMRRRFPTRAYKTSGMNDVWQADLMEMIPYARINKGYKYILNVIDVFSRFARAIPVKSKSGAEIADALTKLFKETKPRHLQTDQGKEFYNSNVKSVLKKYNVNLYSVFSQFKAALVERFNRTLRERMNRAFTVQGNKKWVSLLPKLVYSYNHSIHRSTGLRPVDVSDENSMQLWIRQNKLKVKKKPRYKVGDIVRISRVGLSPFNHNFDQKWSEEVFEIIKIDEKDVPVMYVIKDYYGENVLGKFYEQELQVVDKPTVYRIQTILRTKGSGKNKQYYVKWHGYKDPTWISAKDLVKNEG